MATGNIGHLPVTVATEERGDSVAGVAIDGVGPDPRQGWSTHATGVVLALAGVLVLSPDTLIIRSIQESPSTILFWRSLLTALSLFVLVAIMNRGHVGAGFRAIGQLGLLVALFHACANIAFVAALSQTSVANTLVIIATAPFFAAVLSRIFLGEPIPRRTWVAIGVVVGAVVVVFYGSLQGGGLPGAVIAVGGAVASAATITTIRRARGVSMIPAMVVAAVISSVVALGFGVEVPGPNQLGLFVLQGSILLPAAIALINTAPRFIPAPDVSLINRLEMVLGPIWVWAIFGEVPTTAAIASGIVILLTLTIHTILGLRATDAPLPSH